MMWNVRHSVELTHSKFLHSARPTKKKKKNSESSTGSMKPISFFKIICILPKLGTIGAV